jgi:tRNA G18 (ribose-2'-O)-methylase SpoU
VHYIDNFHETLLGLDAPLVGASMDGKDIYKEGSFPKNQDAVLVMGSEGQGLSPEVREVLQGFVSIPSHSDSGAESLNVAMAASILISEIKRASA